MSEPAAAIRNSDPDYLRLLADIETEEKRSPAASDDNQALLLAPPVIRHLHWLATQHGLRLANTVAHGDRYQQLLDERRLNSVALATLTQAVRRLPA